MHDCGSFNEEVLTELISVISSHFNSGEVLERFEDEGFLNSIHHNLPANRKTLFLEIIRRKVAEIKAALPNPNQIPDKGEIPNDEDMEDID